MTETKNAQIQEASSTEVKESIYLINPNADIFVARDYHLKKEYLIDALNKAHDIIEKLANFDVDVYSLLGMRNLSAFIGEIFASCLIKASNQDFTKNPHQDGYPDLLLMDKDGKELWESLATKLRDKKPFSPFTTSGIEIKATCGSVPTPAACQKKGLEKPDIGDQRIDLLMNYDWKAHHQETNNLMGIFWDFIDRKPNIIAVFYSSELNPDDWGAIIQPKEGGGRTTSVSIMKRSGVKKMYTNSWIIMRNEDRYINFFKKYNQ